MGYFTAGDQYRNEDSVSLLSGTDANDGTTNGTAHEIEHGSVAAVTLAPTASTAGTLDVTVEVRNAAGSWVTAATFTQVTDGTTAETKFVPLAGRAVRAKAVIAATGTYTYSVTAVIY